MNQGTKRLDKTELLTWFSLSVWVTVHESVYITGNQGSNPNPGKNEITKKW
jgi:hypothetical protein